MFSPISMALAYRYFSFLITRTKVKVLTVMAFWCSLHQEIAPLPAEYTQPKNDYRSSEELFSPFCRFSYEDLFEHPELNLAKTEEQQWLQQFASFVDSAKSWAQYHIHEKCIQPLNVKDTNSLLPLLWDRVNTLDIQVHTMNLNINAICAFNLGQTPVDVSDYRVYALTKEAQFRFPEHFLNYFAMFAGLHNWAMHACWLLMDNSLK